MAIKGTRKKRSNRCPVGCRKIKLRMNCSNHPHGLPFPDRQKPDGWAVNPSSRCGTKDTYQMLKEYTDVYSSKRGKEIPQKTQAWAKQQYDIEAKYGKDLIGSMKSMKLKPEIHHILPIMLGGNDTAENYIPIPKKDHQKAHGGVHRWWDRELRAAGKDLERELGMCRKGKNISAKEQALHHCARTRRGYIRITCEGQLTNIAKCLDKNNVKLFVDCKS